MKTVGPREARQVSGRQLEGLADGWGLGQGHQRLVVWPLPGLRLQSAPMPARMASPLTCHSLGLFSGSEGFRGSEGVLLAQQEAVSTGFQAFTSLEAIQFPRVYLRGSQAGTGVMLGRKLWSSPLGMPEAIGVTDPENMTEHSAQVWELPAAPNGQNPSWCHLSAWGMD